MGSNSGFVYSTSVDFAYTAYIIVDVTIINLVFAAAGVLLVLVFLVDLRMAVFVIVIIVKIDIELFGWMQLIGMTLDTLTYAQLVMAVGLTVDYVVHIAHAIADLGGKDSNPTRRAAIALATMGTGVAKGAWTTLLGVLTLIFSQSLAFRTFLQLFCGIIIISVLHGYLLVPSLLIDFPQIYSSKRDSRTMKEPKTAWQSSIQLEGME